MLERTSRTSNLAKILIIEDDPIHRHILQNTLNDGYKLEIAEDSEQALEKLKNDRYDLVIVDLRLPVRLGELATSAESFRILTTLQRDCKNGLVVLAVSGHLTDDLKRQISQFDIVNRILEKPFLRSELRAYVDTQLKRVPV